MATKTLKTWTLEDRGYFCDKDGKRWDCTAESLLEAVRMLDGFGSAAMMQPINDIPGCRTYAAYAKAPRGSGADWSKIGVVFVEGCRDAE